VRGRGEQARCHHRANVAQAPALHQRHCHVRPATARLQGRNGACTPASPSTHAAGCLCSRRLPACLPVPASAHGHGSAWLGSSRDAPFSLPGLLAVAAARIVHSHRAQGRGFGQQGFNPEASDQPAHPPTGRQQDRAAPLRCAALLRPPPIPAVTPAYLSPTCACQWAGPSAHMRVWPSRQLAACS